LSQREDRTAAATGVMGVTTTGGGVGGGGLTRQTRVVKSGRFLYEYGEWKETETRSGYNPLLEDFRNTCVFLASAGPGVGVGAGAGGRKGLGDGGGGGGQREEGAGNEKGKEVARGGGAE
jgi:hypothetical protein